ncbi:uncharacterized protein LOC6051968 [Culex quinquefasciatus]|uniref:uncharacterized protein LOC6051968 n=1 Tax=Culex quinquefasciatus TaxID=7176 RepID=UPI0018E300FA|nr:uncharacterized protein LOC6051968 [Culex quinquefasciatus]
MRRATAPGTCASCGSSTKIHTGAPQLLNPCYCLSDESDRDEGNSVRMMKAKKVNWGGATTTNAGGKVTSVNPGLAAESSENSNTSCMSSNTSLIPHSFSVGEIWKIHTNLKSSNLPQRFPAAKGSSRKTLIAWNSHITDSLPAAKYSFQTTHGLVQTHPSFGKTGPSALPLTVGPRASSSPQLASGIPSIANPNSRSPFRQPYFSTSDTPNSAAIPACAPGRVCPSRPRRKTTEDRLLSIYRRGLHRAGSCRQAEEVGRSDQSDLIPSWWTRTSMMLVEWPKFCASFCCT